jgi:peroxiredoxin
MSKKYILIITLIMLSYTTFAKISAIPVLQDSLPILNRAAPYFQLKDFEGKVVSLSDYKGKVVVLDFWATWCVPCQQSFPAVHKAVKHFAGNQEVVFLFIDTREISSNVKELAKAQMKKNQYPFHVLFDETGPTGLQNKQYLIYDMPGIPTKFIIDRKGIIRYQLIGFNPKQSVDENAAELIRLVERTKVMSK